VRISSRISSTAQMPSDAWLIVSFCNNSSTPSRGASGSRICMRFWGLCVRLVLAFT
jgi:hypothetical protein